MKLYYHPASPNARKPRLVAGLMNLPLDLELVDLFVGAQRQADYLALNPNGLVPTLDDDGFVLWESNAITQYLASKKSNPDLFPSELKARADVVRWQCWDLAHWTPAVQTLMWENVFKRLKGQGEPDAAALERGLKKFHQLAAVLNGALEGREVLVGNRLTLADLSIAAGLTYAAPAAMPLGSYRHIERWFASIQQLEAWKKTAPPALG
jgi:glutathione S-transferase